MKLRRTENEMSELKGVSRQGLIEAVGQELKPCGQPSGMTPVKLSNGQWSLRFNFEHPGHVKMLVDVVLSSPLASMSTSRKPLRSSHSLKEMRSMLELYTTGVVSAFVTRVAPDSAPGARV